MLKLSDVLTLLLEWHDQQTPLRILFVLSLVKIIAVTM